MCSIKCVFHSFFFLPFYLSLFPFFFPFFFFLPSVLFSFLFLSSFRSFFLSFSLFPSFHPSSFLLFFLSSFHFYFNFFLLSFFLLCSFLFFLSFSLPSILRSFPSSENAHILNKWLQSHLSISLPVFIFICLTNAMTLSSPAVVYLLVCDSNHQTSQCLSDCIGVACGDDKELQTCRRENITNWDSDKRKQI